MRLRGWYPAAPLATAAWLLLGRAQAQALVEAEPELGSQGQTLPTAGEAPELQPLGAADEAREQTPQGATDAPPDTAAATPSASGQAPVVAEHRDSGDGEVQVHGRRQAPLRSASDYRIHVGQLAQVPRQNATELLKLAPSVFLMKDGGGDGHANRIYLRGFDAREGQDLEMSVDGVPANDVGNYHGNGYADLNFLIPELVCDLRVLEGPFDPRQGNFAVAGSAEFATRAPEPGLLSQLSYGSFGSARLLSIYGDPDNQRDYAAVDLYRTDGFGQNRAAQRGRAQASWEFEGGKNARLRLTTALYANEYKSAGLLRADDVAAGKLGFFDTYDAHQGGSSSRAHVGLSWEKQADDTALAAQVFFIERGMRLRENYTGYLLDTQKAWQELHQQRGDLLDLGMTSSSFGLRASAHRDLNIGGLSHSVEAGAYARMDLVDTLQQRLATANLAPYQTEASFTSRMGDVSAYLDGSFHLLSWLTLRGGARFASFFYDVNDRCAVKSVSQPSSSTNTQTSCFSAGRFGDYREANQASTTASSRVLPKVSLAIGSFHGVMFSLAYGQGVRSVDPSYITQDVATPFASIHAGEAGATWGHSFERWNLHASSVFFATHVDKDQIFNQTEGRNTLASGTLRAGWAGTVRAELDWLDSSTSLSFVRSRFDDTKDAVPYVPTAVFREDLGLKSHLFGLYGYDIEGRLGLGSSWVGPRALPYGQTSQGIFVTDLSLSLGTRALSFLGELNNVFDQRYREAEFNYSSDFNAQNAATLVPSRMFAAGAPRSVLFSLRSVL